MNTEVYRSKVAWFFGWVWLVFAAANAGDLVARGSLPSALIAGAVLGVVTALVFLLALRPAVVVEQGGVRVRNPLRTAYIPWHAVRAVTVTSALVVDSGSIQVRCWTPMTTARERARAIARDARTAASATASSAERAQAAALAGRTHAEWVAERLTELSATRRDASSGEPRVTWSVSALVVVTAAVALVAVTLLVV